MTQDEQEALIEACVGAHRTRDMEGRLVAPPAWWDLPPDLLDEVHRRQIESRALERLVDPDRQSATVKAVMARIIG